MSKLVTFREQSGYIALMSAIIISVLLMVIAVSISTSGFFSRFNVADTEYKKISQWLAEACVDVAILDIASGAVAAPKTVMVEDSGCQVVSVDSSSVPNVIRVRGVFPPAGSWQAYTNLQVAVTPGAGSVTVNSWEEVQNF